MVALVLASLVVLQGAQATVQVDRTEVAVDGIVTLTLSVRAAASVPVEIVEPAFDGFAVLDRRDRSQVSVEDGIRVTVRDIRLRALRPGTLTIPPFRVRQESQTVESAAITVTVTGAVPVPVELSPRVRAIVQRASPAPVDDSNAVVVSVLPSADTVMLGEQVDLVAAAWFPRDVRDRLRAPPTMLPPDVRGAWGYSQPVPTGVVASREVRGRAYDLFIYHEIVFALRPGDLEIGPATVSYGLPVSGSFLSRELRQEAQSAAFLIAVAPPPVGDARILAARDMAIQVVPPDTALRIGDAAVMTVVVSGVGNVALWPEPELDWPAGVHGYQQRATVDVTPQGGLIAGSKAFEYLVVADTAGRHVLPAPRLTYYDLGKARLVTVTGEPVVIVTPEGAPRASPVRATRPLLPPARWPNAERLARGMPRWGWLLLVGVPPLVAAVFTARRRRPRLPWRGVGSRRGGEPESLGTLEARLRAVLDRLVPGAAARGGESLADALIAAGIEASLAGHAARVRERLRHARYGPEGAADADELTEEVQAVLAGLAGERSGMGGGGIVVGAAVLLLLAAVPAGAQSVEQLWDAGAARAVADSMDLRVRSNPDAPEAWYDLGLAWDRLGAVARAHAAWLRAARLAPRRGPIRAAAAQLRAVDRTGRHLLWVSPVTPWETALLASLLWVIGWVAVVRRRRRIALLALTAAGLVFGLGEIVRARYRAPIAFVLSSATPLREAPYGPAQSETELPEGVAVRVESRRGDWSLVAYGEREGWVHDSELVLP